jgi:mevalonate kinase
VDGGGALVAAVDRGVRCEVHPADVLRIETPGDDRFVRAALEGAPPARYVFSDWNPVHLPPRDGQPQKAGFGGSAAATVVATLAAGFPPERAFAVHRAVQGGGSGVDVHASIHGGVTPFPSGPAIASPPLLAVWSGRSASTGERVKRYLSWPGRADFVERSRALVAAFPSDPTRVFEEAYALLCAMAAEAGVDYDTPEHQHIVALARRHGGAAKPSGAGGGDIAVAIVPDPERRAAFAADCLAAGLDPIEVRIAGPAGEEPACYDT